MLSFKNQNIHINKKIEKTSISFGEKISEYNSKDEEFSLPKDCIILPGYIDKHTHGAAGSDFMYTSQKDVENICLAKAQEGVTSIIATTMTASIEDTRDAINNIVEFIENNKLGKMIKGIHLEGPFLSNNYKGAQPESFIIKGTIESFNAMVTTNIKYIKQITIACENIDEELISYLNKHDICVSIGHSNATHDLIKKQMKLGVNCITHTFNAMSPLHHREIGVVGTALLEDNLYCEAIVDKIHVSKDALRLLYKNKRINDGSKFCLITDSMEASHLEDGFYELGGQKVILKNKEARLENNTLAGSVLKMDDALKNAREILNVSLEDLSEMASYNNAKCLKLNNIGEIKQGNNADFTIVDKDLNVLYTIVSGEVVYKA